MALLAFYPQLRLTASRGINWHRNLAYSDSDEIAYAAYVNALIGGKPRLNDPYTGRHAGPLNAQPESLFSIQFIPAYIVALPARFLGLSAATAFILLMPIVSGASALALFYLLMQLTGDPRLSAAGVVAVLCLATLSSLEGPIAVLRHQQGWGFLPFLRRYIPAVPFPFFILIFAIAWRSLSTKKWHVTALLAIVSGLLFDLLVFSYFYLWTAALAWLACLTAMWALARPHDRARVVLVTAIIGSLAVAALVPYSLLLSRRDSTIDSIQALAKSHAPDIFRPSEIIGAIILLSLFYLVLRSKSLLRRPELLMAASLAFTPLIVFNQQVVTGLSLQPFHYEQFVTGYLALTALIVAVPIWLENQKRRWRSGRLLFWAAVLSFCWGAFETSGTSRGYQYLNELNDDTIPVAKRLSEISHVEPGAIVLSSDFIQSDLLPALTPLPVLWAPHMRSYSGSNVAEDRRRFMQHLYYMGVDERTLAEAITSRDLYICYELFGWERINPVLAVNHSPIRREEEIAALREYADYSSGFNEQEAGRPVISYLVIPAENPPALPNLDRWYARDSCERVDKFVLCRLKLREGQ